MNVYPCHVYMGAHVWIHSMIMYVNVHLVTMGFLVRSLVRYDTIGYLDFFILHSPLYKALLKYLEKKLWITWNVGALFFLL